MMEPPPPLVDRSDQPGVAGRVEGAERFLGDAVRDLVEQSEGELVADDGRELQDLTRDPAERVEACIERFFE